MSKEASLDKLLKELKFIREELKDLRVAVDNNNINTDMVNQIISDLSAKQDITKIIADQEASLIKASSKKKTSLSGESKAPAPNAMNYFKTKYTEDSTFFESVISAEELKTYFEKNAKKIKSIENDKKKIAGMIYTDFLKGNKKKLDMVKKIRDDEINGVVVKKKVEVKKKEESSDESEESEEEPRSEEVESGSEVEAVSSEEEDE